MAAENDSVETVTTQGNKISVSFSRKMSDGNYGGFEATAWLQGDVDPSMSVSEKSMALASLFTATKAAVLDELGIQWSCDDEGVVRETMTPFVSAPQAAAAVQRVIGGNDASNIKVMNLGGPEVSSDPLPQWLIDDCNKLGVTGVWDKRGSRSGKQPYFTEAIPRGASGHGKDGSAKGFWPKD